MGLLNLTLPEHASVTANVGDTVQADQSLIEPQSEEKTEYNLTELLSVPVEDIQKTLHKKVRETFKKGDVIAKGEGNKELRATFQGQIVGFNLQTGIVTVIPNLVETISLSSPIDGTIQSITQNEIVITFSGEVFYAKEGFGKTKKGKLAVVTVFDKTEESALKEVSLSEIDETKHRDAIVVGGYFTRAGITKALSLGAKAIIASQIDEKDISFFETNTLFEPTIAILSKMDIIHISIFSGKEAAVEGQQKRIFIFV